MISFISEIFHFILSDREYQIRGDPTSVERSSVFFVNLKSEFDDMIHTTSLRNHDVTQS